MDWDLPNSYASILCPLPNCLQWSSLPGIQALGSVAFTLWPIECKIKRGLLLGRNVMTKLDSILKGRDIILSTTVCLVRAMVFPVVIYGCESWTIKKAEPRRIDAFELWCWGETLESLGLQGDPTSPCYRKSVLGVHWKDWCWSWNSNILATWCKELTHLKRPWCWEWLKAGEEGDDRGWEG